MSLPHLAPLLQVEGLTRFYRRGLRMRHLALDGVTCSLQRGVVNALLGQNGAGKTTLLRILLGQLRPHAGRVRWSAPHPSCRYLPEDGFLAPALQGRHWAPVLGVSGEELAAVAEPLGVAHLLRRPARSLSKGERRRCELALVLAGRAELYILDEPASGLDQGQIENLKGAIRALLQRGCTVLLSTHLLREWEDTVDRVVLLHRGRVRREEELADLLASYRLWVPALTPAPALPPVAFPLPGRALAPAHAAPPAGWDARPATLADVFLKEIADDGTGMAGSGGG